MNLRKKKPRVSLVLMVNIKNNKLIGIQMIEVYSNGFQTIKNNKIISIDGQLKHTSGQVDLIQLYLNTIYYSTY